MSSSRAIAKNLKKYRQQRELTQEELAKLAGCGRSTITEAENGQGCSIKMLEKLSKPLKCSLTDLLSEE